MKIILLDDHYLFQYAFKLVLEEFIMDIYEECSIICCKSVFEVEKNIDNEMQILFIDYLIPNVNVLEYFNIWKSINHHIKIVVLSSIINTNKIAEILGKGACSFLSKTCEAEELKICINSILNEEIYISKEFHTEVLKNLTLPKKNIFTIRELEIIELIKQGKSIKEKAKLLFLSENTIIVHRKNIMQKAGVKSVTELLAKLEILL